MNFRCRLMFLVGALLLAGLAVQAQAETVTVCGASKGQSYFFQGLLNTSPGWKDDGISNGKIELVRDRGNIDIFYADTVGSRSMRADGFEILAIPQPTPEFVMVVAINLTTGIVEHYLFQLDRAGNGTVLWGSIKGGGAPIAKSGLYRSECRHP